MIYSKSFCFNDDSAKDNCPNKLVTHKNDRERTKPKKWLKIGRYSNKKEQKIYSKEDIREQYCINKKELQVFEQNIHKHKKFLRCLSANSFSDKSIISSHSLPKRKIVNDVTSQEIESRKNVSNQSNSDKNTESNTQETKYHPQKKSFISDSFAKDAIYTFSSLEPKESPLTRSLSNKSCNHSLEVVNQPFIKTKTDQIKKPANSIKVINTSNIEESQRRYAHLPNPKRKIIVKTKSTQTDKGKSSNERLVYTSLKKLAKNEIKDETKNYYVPSKNISKYASRFSENSTCTKSSLGVHENDKNKHKQTKKLSVSKSFDPLYLERKDKKEIINLFKTIKPKRLRLYECLSSPLQSKDLILLDTKFMKKAKFDKIYEIKFRSFDQINNKEADNEVRQLMQIRRHSYDAHFAFKKSSKTEKEQHTCSSSNIQYATFLNENIKDAKLNQQEAFSKDSTLPVNLKCIDDNNYENNLFHTIQDKQDKIKSNLLITKTENSNICFSYSNLEKHKDTCCDVLKPINYTINRSHDLENCEQYNIILTKSKQSSNQDVIMKESESKSSQINSTDAHSSTTTSGSFEINDNLSDYTREQKIDQNCDINFDKKLTNNSNNLEESSCLSLGSDNAENKSILIDHIDVTEESSQATEKDLAMSEYSLQHSSEEISQNSFSQSEGHTNTSEIFDKPKCRTLARTTVKDKPKSDQNSIDAIDNKKPNLKCLYNNSVSQIIKFNHKSNNNNSININDTNNINGEEVLKTQPNFFVEHNIGLYRPVSCDRHIFRCIHCRELKYFHSKIGSYNQISDKIGSNYPYKRFATIESIISCEKEEDEYIGVIASAYKSGLWVQIGEKDVLKFRIKKIQPNINSEVDNSENKLNLFDLTLTEKIFMTHYKSITHRLIHRKASYDMYSQLMENKFNINKSVELFRNQSEFGFRIHGSRPIVISAIEKGTPADICGLDAGDIIVKVNGIDVLDLSHSEVVRLATENCQSLNLDLICNCEMMKNQFKDIQDDVIFSSFLNYESVNSITSCDKSLCHEWKRRWFVLKNDFCLYWYHSSEYFDPYGVVNLKDCKAIFESQEISNGQYVFKLTKHGSIVNFFTSNEKELAQKWVQYINSSASKVTKNNPYIINTGRNIHMMPIHIKDSDCRGYLNIFNQKAKIWKKRYFILKDACLYIFFDIYSSIALSLIYLHGYKVKSVYTKKSKCTFEIKPSNEKDKHFWLMAMSDNDKKRWTAALEYSIDRWIKLD